MTEPNKSINKIKVGVIISTYNKPEWLEKVLWGYQYQTIEADEIIIADDGSRNETKELINSFKNKLPIKHVWQEDEGFQKSRILNKALVASKSDYIIFTDQDCIPKPNFIETHLRYSEVGYFLSGGYFKLTMNISNHILLKHIEELKVFSISWLLSKKQPLSFKLTKLINNKSFKALMNFVTPTKATWNGCNASGWREDMIKVNGYNEEMHYGGQDREFGERLLNLGIRPKQIRYSAIVVHLDHKRPYKTKESIKNNINIRKATRKSKIIETPNGIIKRG